MKEIKIEVRAFNLAGDMKVAKFPLGTEHLIPVLLRTLPATEKRSVLVAQDTYTRKGFDKAVIVTKHCWYFNTGSIQRTETVAKFYGTVMTSFTRTLLGYKR